MRSGAARVAMVVVGLLSLAVYVAGAFVAYAILSAVWADRPSAATVVALLAGATLVGGYLSYRFGTSRLLSSLDASELARHHAPQLYHRLDAFCARMDIEVPHIHVSHLDEPNAFAVGGANGGVIVVDRSLFGLLTPAELDAVLCHELAHLEGRDSLVQVFSFTALQTVLDVLTFSLLPVLLLVTGVAKASAWMRGTPGAWTQTFAGRLRVYVGTFVLVIPAALTLVLLARSRRREFAADERAARVTGDPLAMARALAKIDAASRRALDLRSVFDPTADNRDLLTQLLSTHPDTDERIDRLRRLATER